MVVHSSSFVRQVFVSVLLGLSAFGCSGERKSELSNKSNPQSLDSYGSSSTQSGSSELHRIGVIADVEGNWAKIQAFANYSTVLRINSSSDPDHFDAELLGDHNKLVFIGDSIDKGPDNIKVLKFFLYLKERYPNRVFLILGNRDINKLRFNWELEDRALALNVDPWENDRLRLYDWAALFARWSASDSCEVNGTRIEYLHGAVPHLDRILKLKFLLANTLGSPNAFSDMKRELRTESDAVVYQNYRGLVQRDGLLGRYLRHAQLMYFDRETSALFVHGGVSEQSFGVVPETSLGRGDARTLTDFNEWMQELNQWSQNAISAGLAGDVIAALPLIQYQEPQIVPDDRGRPTWAGMLPNPISVIYGRPWTTDYNLGTIEPATMARLREVGINKVIYGHSPVGQIPVIMKSEDGFLSVACDTSVTEPPRNASVEVSLEGVRVQAQYFEPVPGGSQLEHLLSYDSQNIETGRQVEHEGYRYWQIGQFSDGRVLRATWTQARTREGRALTFGVPRYEWVTP